MSVDWSEKFANGSIVADDADLLWQEIISTPGSTSLSNLVYIFGYSFQDDRRIIDVCDAYIKQPVPGLTAVCMRVVIDYWGLVKRYRDALLKYLNMDLFDEWYDEVIFASTFVSSLSGNELDDELKTKLEQFRNDVRARGKGLAP